MDLKITCKYDELWTIDELKEAFNPKNPNKHPEDQLDSLITIFEKNWFRDPVVISKLSGYITRGHGRVLAASKAGIKELPVEYQEYESPEQEYQDMVADNAIGRRSDLDFAMINIDMQSLGPDIDINAFGLKEFVVDPIEIREKEVDENLETKNTCPSCGYEW